MKILVINGSPKGKYSVTFQSVRYLEKHRPDDEFRVFHVGQKIKALERDRALFDTMIASVRESDCVLWCYPVYTFLVPYQVMRFVDLVFERNEEAAFQDKYASQLSTSKHFYDHTAHNYLYQICEDLGMKHLPGHSADMDDLTTEQGRARLLSFGAELENAVERAAPVPRRYVPVEHAPRPYNPPPDLPGGPKPVDHRIVLVTDCTDSDSNLGRMIDTYRHFLPNELTVVNISEFGLQGGCLGCLHCEFMGQCIYRDGFDEMHQNTIQTADGLIFAASIHRHGFDSIWKCFDDRQYYNGHRTVRMGKSIGYIISGPLRHEPNLREVLEARSEIGHLYQLDMVTDEYESDEEITALLKNLAEQTMWAIEHKPQRPMSFLGVGGHKVLRDLIYVLGGLTRDDHLFYKEHGFYDFPQKQVKSILTMKIVGLLMRASKDWNKAERIMKDGVQRRYDQIIERY